MKSALKTLSIVAISLAAGFAQPAQASDSTQQLIARNNILIAKMKECGKIGDVGLILIKARDSGVSAKDMIAMVPATAGAAVWAPMIRTLWGQTPIQMTVTLKNTYENCIVAIK